jgi:hypothetical protein
VRRAGDVKLVTVDPVQAFLPAAVNSWKGQHVRLALEPVRQLAAERGIAIVLIQHVNRRSDSDPLARIADSQGVPQLARSVMIWDPDPSDPEGDHGIRKVLTRAKGNLARGSTASAMFTIVERTVAGGLEGARARPRRRRPARSGRRYRRGTMRTRSAAGSGGYQTRYTPLTLLTP